MTENPNIEVKLGEHKEVVSEPNAAEKNAEPVIVTREDRSHRYSESTLNLDFGCALEAMRNGKAIYRKNWNCEKAGNRCKVFLVNFNAKHLPRGMVMAVMKAPDGSMTQWHPSIPDMLSEDWCFCNVEEDKASKS